MARTVLVTGAAGFIGAALSQRLLQAWVVVIIQAVEANNTVSALQQTC